MEEFLGGSPLTGFFVGLVVCFVVSGVRNQTLQRNQRTCDRCLQPYLPHKLAKGVAPEIRAARMAEGPLCHSCRMVDYRREMGEIV